MAHHSGIVIESQVDYLRASAHGDLAALKMRHLAQGLTEEEKARGNRERRWRLMGYEGTHTGRVAYGKRDEQSTIIDLSGNAANEYLPAVLALADTVTRVDLAVTWRADPPAPLLGPNAYQQMLDWYKQDTRRARPSTTNDGAGGYTAYLGARTSENYLRIYDKEAECRSTGDYPGITRYQNCWRYELEVKGGLSGKLAREVNDETERYRFVRNYLYRYLTAHGVEPAFAADGDWGLLPGFSRRSDDDVSLRHLAKNVAPTVKRLRAHGRETEVRTALGFDGGEGSLRQLQGILHRYDVPSSLGRIRRSSADGQWVVRES